MNLQQAQQTLISGIQGQYTGREREITIIADWVLEHLTGWKKIDRILHKNDPLSPETLASLHRYTAELAAGRPVQYVLGECWFFGMKFYVDEQVLIPRPETEELVRYVIDDITHDPRFTPLRTAPPQSPSPHPESLRPGSLYPAPPHPDPLHSTHTSSAASRSSISGSDPASGAVILDVGTGSGCIPIALARHLPAATIHSCDLSAGALSIARKNASTNDVNVHFHQLDFLDRHSWQSLPSIDILVSNPPYIPLTEKQEMATHVVDFEPHLALFVPDNHPLLFYEALAEFGRQRLRRAGKLLVETHEEGAGKVANLFHQFDFQYIKVIKDMQGKDRFVIAVC